MKLKTHPPRLVFPIFHLNPYAPFFKTFALFTYLLNSEVLCTPTSLPPPSPSSPSLNQFTASTQPVCPGPSLPPPHCFPPHLQPQHKFPLFTSTVSPPPTKPVSNLLGKVTCRVEFYVVPRYWCSPPTHAYFHLKRRLTSTDHEKLASLDLTFYLKFEVQRSLYNVASQSC